MAKRIRVLKHAAATGLAVCLMWCGALLGPAAWREIPYGKLHEAFTAVKPLEDARFIQLRYTVARSDADTAGEPVRLVIASAGGDLEVAVGADGTVDFPISAGLLEENPPVRTNAPAGGLSIGMTIDIAAPPAERFPYALLVDMEDEYARMVKKQGLMARMMAPSPSGLSLSFAAGESASATVGGRRSEVFHVDEDGQLRIPSRREWRRENPEVVLSHVPQAISLAFRD